MCVACCVAEGKTVEEKIGQFDYSANQYYNSNTNAIY